MRSIFVTSLAFLAVFALSGCSWFSSDDPATEAASTELATPALVPVQAVRSIEVGRTRDGIVVSAFGTAPGLGFGAPQLIARRDGKPNRDGFLEFDFVAQPPDPGFDLPAGTLEARAIRADLPIRGKSLNNVRGLRVFAANNGVQFIFTFG